MNDIAQYVLSGLSVGCVTALVALGFVIIANVTGVYNFAQGDYVMVGGMVTAWALAHGASWLVAVILAMGVVTAVAALQERLTVAPVRGRSSPLALVVASLGVAVVLRGAALLIFGRDPLRAPPITDGAFTLLGAHLTDQVLWVWATTAAALGGVLWLFYRTHLGRAMRAAAVSPLGARLVGLRIGPLSFGAFCLGGALSGLVGAMTVPLTFASWDRGVTIGLVGFIAAALAGFTSPSRAVLAGLALGVLEALAGGLIASSYRSVFVYGALLVYLLVADLAGPDGVIKRLLRTGPARPRWAAAVPLGPRRRLPRMKPWRLPVVPLVCLLAALVFPAVASGPKLMDAAVMALLMAVGATGLSLVMGLAGQLSLGQGAFYLVGGYCSAILTAKHGWGPGTAMVAGVALAAAVGLAVGWLTLRLQGFNLALATLAVHLILIVVVTEQDALTGGELGILGVPQGGLLGLDFSDPGDFYYVALVALVACLLVGLAVARSRIGLGLRALGVDQEGAEALGVRTLRLKLVVFVLGSAMGGLGGVLWVYYVRFADPSTWGISLTIDLVAFVVVGGLSSIYGGAVGALAVEAVRYGIGTLGLSETSSQQIELMLTGALVIVFVLIFRNGITGLRRFRAAPRPRVVAVDSARVVADPGSGPAPSLAAAHVGETVLTVSGLSRRFGGFPAVDALDFELRSGEITALVGPNGAGKSTVINLLAGRLVPSAGRITMSGTRIDGLAADYVARRGLARTFQTPSLFEGLTVAETVQLAAPGDITWALDRVGLSELSRLPAATLTTGQQRLLDVARSLAARPAVLLLDEPAAGLDETETTALGALIVELAGAGAAVLLVEHSMALVMAIADRVIVLDQGRKIADGAPASVGSDERVVEAYLGVPV